MNTEFNEQGTSYKPSRFSINYILKLLINFKYFFYRLGFSKLCIQTVSMGTIIYYYLPPQKSFEMILN
jgi:hypothetical protein